MSDDDPLFDTDHRRSFLKKGALASGALALGASGATAAQDDDDLLDDEGGEALIMVDNFHPYGRFAFVSGVVNWVPRIPDVRDSIWTDYNTYQIRWLGTNEVVPLWVAQDASVGEYDEDLGFVTDINEDIDRPQVWEMDQEWNPLGDNQLLTEVEFSPVAEEDEEDILDNDQWWAEDDEAAGTDTGTGTPSPTPDGG